ncbi:MAG: YciI family protein [Xanthomonadales bacterium]|nr:YciI family protein [Xanthomonadales bacterium]
MKYMCLGYYDEAAWNARPESERNELIDACFAYDDELRAGGHFAGGEALAPAQQAVTVRAGKGRVSVTDGPFAETKEQIGGVLILEARDLNHAIQLLSNHPGAQIGPFEIRAIEDMGPMLEESARRRGVTTP